MPPKKKKSKKKSSKKKGKAKSASGRDGPAEPIKTESEELLIKQLEDLRARSNEFVAEIERLRANAKKREHDTTDMVNLLETKVKAMDKENKTLASELKMLTLQQIADKKGMKRHFELTLKQAERVFLGKEGELLESNKSLTQEVSDLTQFQKVREELGLELEETRNTILENEQRHQNQLEELTRKFYEARDRLEREAEARIAHSRQVYKEEVGKELDMDSKRIRKQNKNMEKELKFQKETSKLLESENVGMKGDIKRLRAELGAVERKDEEYALKGLRQATRIKELQDKTTTLENSLKQVVEENAAERKSSAATHQRQLTELNKRTKECMRTIKIKGKDINAIKSHARTILTQRNQVEKLFIQGLEQTKKNVVRTRQEDYVAKKHHYDQKLASMTQVLPDGSYPSAAELGPPPKHPPKRALTLADLTQKERDECLRLVVELLRHDPEACAIMGGPFASHSHSFLPSASTASQRSAGMLSGVSELSSRSLSRHSLVSLSKEQIDPAALTFLTDPSMSYEEREREVQTIL